MTAIRNRRRLLTEQLTARTLTEAESLRRYRAGHRAAGKGQHDPVWREPPVNGRPVRWYTYRGSGPFASEEA